MQYAIATAEGQRISDYEGLIVKLPPDDPRLHKEEYMIGRFSHADINQFNIK